MNELKVNIDLQELRQSLQQSYIHYDPTRVDYTITDGELNELAEMGKSSWKEIFFCGIGLAIPAIINGFVTMNKVDMPDNWNREVGLNFLFGSCCLSVALVAVITWIRQSKKKNSIINRIKSKPQFLLPTEEKLI